MKQLSIREHHLYILLTVLTSLGYLYMRFFVQDATLFGFNQLRHIKFRLVFVAYAIAGILIFAAPWISRRGASLWGLLTSSPYQRWIAAGLALAGFALFFGFRNQFINPDGLQFAAKFETDIPDMGAHITHDEIWELFFHSKFWQFTNTLFGWSVPFSYQVMSAFAGGVFLVVLYFFATRLHAQSGLLFLGILSAGYMQLFFGDVENYTLVSVWILLYLYAAYRFLQQQLPFWAPVVVFTIAISFHMLAGWMLPSLLYLSWVAAVQRKRYQSFILSALLSMLIFGLTLTYFHYNGLPLEKFYNNSHSFGHGGDYQRMLATPSPGHYWQITNLLFLLFPVVLYFVPMIFYRRIPLSKFNLFLIFAAIPMLALLYIWNPMLGVYNDWNLFAPGLIPLAILFWRNYAAIDDLQHKARISAGMLVFAALHSYAWIISNHFYVP